MPTSANKLMRSWMGPCEVIRKNSPYSCMIEFNGKRHHCHANHLRKYNECVAQAVSNSCAIVFDVDHDFGDIPTLELQNESQDTHVETSSSVNSHRDASHHVEQSSNSKNRDNTNSIRDNSTNLIQKPNAFDSTGDEADGDCSQPSTRIRAEQLQHLSQSQRDELLKLLNEFPRCFREKPGFCPYVEHCINISADFRPKRLKEYRIPEILKPEIQRQIDELLKNGFIRPSTSSMASPIVPVLKGPS